VQADYTYSAAGDVTPPGREFETRKNDTSVVLAKSGARVRLANVEVRKYGYSSNVNDATLRGLNAAVAIVSSPPPAPPGGETNAHLVSRATARPGISAM